MYLLLSSSPRRQKCILDDETFAQKDGVREGIILVAEDVERVCVPCFYLHHLELQTHPPYGQDSSVPECREYTGLTSIYMMSELSS